MKINNIFDGNIFDSEGKIAKGDTDVVVSEEDGKLLIKLGQAELVKPPAKTKGK